MGVYILVEHIFSSGHDTILLAGIMLLDFGVVHELV